MGYSGYAAWSVIFGEQPSASKWNILGTNDAEFNSKALQAVNRQDNTSNSSVSNQLLQQGWGFMLGNGTVAVDETVTFPVAFDERPNVQNTSIGNKNSSDPSHIGDFGVGGEFANVHTITTTTFDAYIEDPGGALGATRRFGYAWIAIGTNA